MMSASIALNRFGLGARPGDRAPDDPARWLTAQFDAFDPRPPVIAAAPSRRVVAAELAEYLEQTRMLRGQNGPRSAASATPAAVDMMVSADARPGAAAAAPASAPDDARRQVRRAARQQGRASYVAAIGARASSALTTPAPFVERLVHFWANHFAVSADKLTVVGMAGLLEFEAIRPNVLGRFGDMLNAVERHPAMLLYLDQAQSVGPNSPVGLRVAARRNRRIGLNENLAREIMELHTLGVRTGYSQADVTEFARAMTGWTVSGIGRGPGARFRGSGGLPGDFAFAGTLHEPGERTIMGKRYAEGGERQAQAVLGDLAIHPATAMHLCTKLARHFAGDAPPPALVARMQAAYLASGGDLPTVYHVLIDAPEAWRPAPAKFKTPWEWSISSLRALGTNEVQSQQITALLNQLGQPTWRPGSPAGFDDIAASWAGPDAVLRRVEAAERLAARATGTVDARSLAATLFPASLSEATGRSLAQAESPGQALALLLVAPESMRR